MAHSSMPGAVSSDVLVLDNDLDMGDVYIRNTSLDPEIAATLKFEGREQARRRMRKDQGELAEESSMHWARRDNGRLKPQERRFSNSHTVVFRCDL